MSDTMSAPHSSDDKGEYQIKSSGSDGIKITFNKTKMSKGLKSPKHTGLKPGVNSGPASKKSSGSGKSSSQKLLYSKSSSSSSLDSSHPTILNFKSSSQPGKSSRDNKSNEAGSSSFANFTGSSNDMLKNMLSLASPGPRPDIMKAFDRKFQIPKLSARVKSDEKPSTDEAFNSMHPRSAPTTPIQSSNPSPTMDFMRDGSSSQFQISQQKFLPSQSQQNKFFDHNQVNQSKKLFKSVSSEQLYGDSIDRYSSGSGSNATDNAETDFQAFLKAQTRKSDSSASMPLKSPKHPLGIDGNMNQAGDGQGMPEVRNVFNDNDLIDLNFGTDL